MQMTPQTTSFNEIYEDRKYATADFVEEHNQQVLESYKSHRDLIEEHVNQEIAAAEGAYGKRQIFELVQNAADAARGFPDGRITVILTPSALYCANTGEPITIGGVRAILQSFLSRKHGGEIGRYGLGFKSVLGVSDNPEFYGLNVSFGFDPIWASSLIRDKIGYTGVVPKLRLAKIVDKAAAARIDPLLSELLEWATTVVKLPFRDSRHNWLSEDINNFPGEFLLFCPDVKELILEDRTHPDSVISHHFSRRGENPVQVLVNGKSSDWRVFNVLVQPSEEAKLDGGYFAGRDSVSLSWAVPVKGGLSDGKFWAYFPLEKENMSLKGVLNAAWKLNDDRQNILDGLFNDELLKEAAVLALKNLPVLFEKGDPGKLLEIYPARLAERVGADLRLTKLFYDAAPNFPTLPDCRNNLRLASELKLPPKNIPDTAVEEWARCPYLPKNWAHPSTIANTTRSARIDQLMAEGQYRMSAAAWLEALVEDDNINDAMAEHGISEENAKIVCSSHAVRAAAAILDDNSTSAETRLLVKQARIVLTVKGDFVNAEKNVVFLPSEEGQDYDNLNIVHPKLIKENLLSNIFERLEITPVDATSELKSLLSAHTMNYFSDEKWEYFWKLVGRIENNEETKGRSAIIIAQHCAGQETSHIIRAKTLSGHFQKLRNVLLPGAILDEANEEDRAVIIDTEFHSDHKRVLAELGAVEAPSENGGSRSEAWFTDYERDAIDYFMNAKSADSPRPSVHKLAFREQNFIGPLEPLICMKDKGRERFTSFLCKSRGVGEKWHFRHISSSSYPEVEVDSPPLWVIKRYGRFRTSKGIRRLEESVGSKLNVWDKFFPVIDADSETQALLNLPQTLEEIPSSLIDEALEAVPEVFNPFLIGAFYSALSEIRVAPEKIWCRIGETSGWFSPEEVTALVAHGINDSFISILKKTGKPFLIVEEKNDAVKLKNNWRLRPVEQTIRLETKAVASGPEIPLSDAFAGLGYMLTSEQSKINLIPCSSLRREVFTDQGVDSENKTFINDGNCIFYIDTLSSQELLENIAETLELELSDYDIKDILGSKKSAETQSLIQRIRDAESHAEKLLMCVGADKLKKWLSKSLLDIAEAKHKTLDDKTIAELFLAVYGVESLSKLKEDLASAGFEVPLQWAGSHKARRFVRDLGFPPEYAGFESAERKAAIDIEGSPALPPLHPFQDKATKRIKGLLLAGGKNPRGLLSLPTGAGKTRVAVEAIVKTIRDDNFPGPILWIAQSDELCEQAVKSWEEVWRAVGSQLPLRLNRLWASNEADEWNEGPQVVVATMQKLVDSVIKNSEYDWLKNCSALIIDEAHLSTTPAYTQILEWAGATRSSSRCPILGLTATPFRGGEEETRRLAFRYGNNRLDEDLLGDSPYKTLQNMGVLADVSHRLLEGVEIELTERELGELRMMKRLPETAMERIGANKDRNDLIIETVKKLPPDWSILLFAVSVDNAKTIAAMLAADGITAAAISSETAPGARRHYIEKFRKGEIKVLTNYGVLTTGFDAPAVRAIIVARPTFSPVVYQQMIGRGLRGPLNGGKSECLIINVKDNFEKYGEKLAFTEFEYLWKKD